MKISTKCRYGLRAMIEIARHSHKGPVKRKDITESQGISKAYLENILITLKNRNLIQTVRGANGGFTLNREPSKITMYDIVSALEGSLAPVGCLEKKSDCDRTSDCVARWAWGRLYEAHVGALKGMTLQDLLDKAAKPEEISYAI